LIRAIQEQTPSLHLLFTQHLGTGVLISMENHPCCSEAASGWKWLINSWVYLITNYSSHREMLHMKKQQQTYHWIFDNCKKINNICSIAQILENLDFSFYFLLLHRLSQTWKQPQGIILYYTVLSSLISSSSSNNNKSCL